MIFGWDLVTCDDFGDCHDEVTIADDHVTCDDFGDCYDEAYLHYLQEEGVLLNTPREDSNSW
jgi:hypothetical protein